MRGSRLASVQELCVTHKDLQDGVARLNDVSIWLAAVLPSNLAGRVVQNAQAIGDLVSSVGVDVQKRMSKDRNDEPLVIGDILARWSLRVNDIYLAFYRTIVSSSTAALSVDIRKTISFELQSLVNDRGSILTLAAISYSPSTDGQDALAENIFSLLQLPLFFLQRWHQQWCAVRDETSGEHPDVLLLDEGLDSLAFVFDSVHKVLAQASSQPDPTKTRKTSGKAGRDFEGLRMVIKGLDSLHRPGQRCLVAEGEVCLMNAKKRYHMVLFNDLIAFANLTDIPEDQAHNSAK